MKKSNNNKQVKKNTKVSAPAPEVTVSAPAPVVEITPAPAPAMVINGVQVNPVGTGFDLEMGSAIASKRITNGARIDRYRVVSSQRKTDNAGYYVQGGYVYIKPGTTRELFTVAVEIPYPVGTMGLRSAQERCMELNADLERSRSRATA